MAIPTANSLVTALATGQPGSFAAIYDRLGRSMLRVAGVMLRDSEEAEDAVQDVFVEIARRPERLRQVINLEAYMFAILRNNITRRLHAKRKELKHLRQLPERAVTVVALQRDDLDQGSMALAAICRRASPTWFPTISTASRAIHSTVMRCGW